MTRIYTDQPSSGKPQLIYIPTSVNGGFVNTSWYTVIEAPDFSVPGSGNDGVTLDPSDSSRELKAGEVFFETPLQVINKTSTTRWVELQMILEGASEEVIPLSPRISIPSDDSVYLAIQGLRLIKRNFAAVNGGRLQVRAEVNNAIKIIGAAVELLSQDHEPDTETP
jgi:hypothetical protein